MQNAECEWVGASEAVCGDGRVQSAECEMRCARGVIRSGLYSCVTIYGLQNPACGVQAGPGERGCGQKLRMQNPKSGVHPASPDGK